MVKGVSFKKKDIDLLEFIEDKDFSYYVKELIRKDMAERNGGAAAKVKAPARKVKRNTEFEF